MTTKRKAAVAPFRVYSGWDSRQAEAAEVFKFSVQEHASVPIEHRFVSADRTVGVVVCR